MIRSINSKRFDYLLFFLVVYAAASLFHHIHNAEFLDQYPNLPEWLSRGKVYAAWVATTMVGVIGYSLMRWRYEKGGL